MMKKYYVVLLLMLVALTTVLQGCTKDDEPTKSHSLQELIIGTWILTNIDPPSNDIHLKLEFYKDGTYKATDQPDNKPYKWSFDNDNVLKMERHEIPQKVEFDNNGNTMFLISLDASNGIKAMIFRRQ